jgi:hypothetical protein
VSATAPDRSSVHASSVTQAVERICRVMVRLPDEAMDRPWAWRMYDEEGLRFALLMTHHELRDLAVRLAAARAGSTPGESERIRAQYHEAYRDLTGLMHRVRDDELDREPAPEQWPVRQVIRHMIGALYGFSAVVQLATDAHGRGEPLREPTDDEFARAKGMPAPQDRIASGDREDVANALFAAHRRALGAMALVPDEQLGQPALFWDGEMPLRFRLHRFEAHLRQHTIQVEKTLLGIGHPATEAERLVRLVHVALAGVESLAADGVCEDERAAVARIFAERGEAVAAVPRDP